MTLREPYSRSRSASTEQSGAGSRLVVTPAKRTYKHKDVSIEEIEDVLMKFTIVGKSQLIVNNFDHKITQQMEDDRALSKEERLKRKKEGRTAVTPEEIKRRFQNARLLDSGGNDCVRSSWIKGALITAAGYPDVGIARTKLKGALYVEGDLLPIKYKPKPAKFSSETITYFGKGPAMRRDPVRVGKFGSKQPDLRYRPAYDDWSIDFEVTFEPRLITLPEVVHLIRRAGMSVGLCEWRPEGPGGGKGGQFGRFDLKR